jgi:hypothetical protein
MKNDNALPEEDLQAINQALQPLGYSAHYAIVVTRLPTPAARGKIDVSAVEKMILNQVKGRS